MVMNNRIMIQNHKYSGLKNIPISIKEQWPVNIVRPVSLFYLANAYRVF